MLNKKTLLKIKKLALKIDHDIAFGGKSKGNKHLLRVTKIAQFLAQKIGADANITIAGAFLHDTALPSGNDYKYSNNKKIVKELIKYFDLSQDELNKISECVASHEGTVKPKILEAKIVHDSDVLDKIGLLGIIRHTWKTTNKNELNPSAIKKEDVDKIINHISWRQKQLQTLIAKKIANYLTTPINQKEAKTIVSFTANLANQGVITEKIAVAIHKYINNKQNTKLKEQLNLNYLKLFK